MDGCWIILPHSVSRAEIILGSVPQSDFPVGYFAIYSFAVAYWSVPDKLNSNYNKKTVTVNSHYLLWFRSPLWEPKKTKHYIFLCLCSYPISCILFFFFRLNIASIIM
jgi:hypothetical protein